jgi:hypothetical protein
VPKFKEYGLSIGRRRYEEFAWVKKQLKNVSSIFNEVFDLLVNCLG